MDELVAFVSQLTSAGRGVALACAAASRNNQAAKQLPGNGAAPVFLRPRVSPGTIQAKNAVTREKDLGRGRGVPGPTPEPENLCGRGSTFAMYRMQSPAYASSPMTHMADQTPSFASYGTPMYYEASGVSDNLPSGSAVAGLVIACSTAVAVIGLAGGWWAKYGRHGGCTPPR